MQQVQQFNFPTAAWLGNHRSRDRRQSPLDCQTLPRHTLGRTIPFHFTMNPRDLLNLYLPSSACVPTKCTSRTSRLSFIFHQQCLIMANDNWLCCSHVVGIHCGCTWCLGSRWNLSRCHCAAGMSVRTAKFSLRFMILAAGQNAENLMREINPSAGRGEPRLVNNESENVIKNPWTAAICMRNWSRSWANMISWIINHPASLRDNFSSSHRPSIAWISEINSPICSDFANNILISFSLFSARLEFAPRCGRPFEHNFCSLATPKCDHKFYFSRKQKKSALDWWFA